MQTNSSSAPPAASTSASRSPPPVAVGHTSSIRRSASGRRPLQRLRQSFSRPSSRPASTPPSSAPPRKPPVRTKTAKSTAAADSDAWTAPADHEGALVRVTYAYFAQHPIRGDGRVAGEERTRHKAGGVPPLRSNDHESRYNKAAVSDVNLLPAVAGSPSSRTSLPQQREQELSSSRLQPESESESKSRPNRPSSTLGLASSSSGSPVPSPATSPATLPAGQGARPPPPSASPHASSGGTAGISRKKSNVQEQTATTPMSLLEPPGSRLLRRGDSHTLRHATSTSSHGSRTTGGLNCPSQSSLSASLAPPESPISHEMGYNAHKLNSNAEGADGNGKGQEQVQIQNQEQNQHEVATQPARVTDQYGFFEPDDPEGKSFSGRALVFPSRVFQKLPHRPRFEAMMSDGRLGASSASLATGRSEGKNALVRTNTSLMNDEQVSAQARKEARLGLERRQVLDRSHHVRDQARTSKWQQMLVTTTSSGGVSRPITSPTVGVGSEVQRGRELQNHVQVEFDPDVPPGAIRRRVLKGIPNVWRSLVWPLLIRLRRRADIEAGLSIPGGAGGETLWTHYQFPQDHRHRSTTSQGRGPNTSSDGHANREKIVDTSSNDSRPLDDAFGADLLLQSQPLASRYDVQIDLDVPRTMNGHCAFYTRYGRGQVQLFQVLHAMSLHCPDTCGYCQGMGPLAATMLLQLLSPGAAYTALTGLHDHYFLHAIWQPGFPGLHRLFFIQQKLVQAYLPSLALALEEADITPSSYATRWYITLFQGTVPYATQLRIWDAFLLLGPDVLLITGLALLWGVAQTLPLVHSSSHAGGSSGAGIGTGRSGRDTGADARAGGGGAPRPSRRLLSASRSRPATPRAAKGFETLLRALSSFFLVEDDDALMDWVARMLDRTHVQNRLAQAHQAWTQLETRGETDTLML